MLEQTAEVFLVDNSDARAATFTKQLCREATGEFDAECGCGTCFDFSRCLR